MYAAYTTQQFDFILHTADTALIENPAFFSCKTFPFHLRILGAIILIDTLPKKISLYLFPPSDCGV